MLWTLSITLLSEGSKHGQVYEKSAQVYWNYSILSNDLK